MIVKMKKISLLLYHQEKKQFLGALQDAGFVHIVEDEHKDTGPLRSLELEIRETERVLHELAQLKKGCEGAAESGGDLLPVVAEFLLLRQRRETLAAEMKNLERDEQQQLPLGAVDPAIVKKLEAAGVPVRLYTAHQKEFARLAASGLLIAEGSRRQPFVFFAVIGGAVPDASTAQEVPLPQHSLREIAAKKTALAGQIRQIEEKLAAFAGYRGQLLGFLAEKQDAFSFKNAGLDFASLTDGRVLAMQGFYPADREEELRRLCSRFTLWCSTADPGPEEQVPVLLKNSAFARLFEPVTRLYMLPGYGEIDPTPVLAPFFSLFVGLCLGDVAYGAIIVLAAALAWSKASAGIRPYAVLSMILGAMTILCGLLLNSCFGEPLFGGPGIERAFFAGGAQYCFLSSYKTQAGVVEFPAMNFSLLLGFIQILVAMTMQTIVRIRRGGLISGLMPVSQAMMFLGLLVWGAHINAFNLAIGEFAVGKWQLGSLLLALPLASGKLLLLGGAVMVLLFNSPGKKIFVRPLLGLWDLYNFATGILGDMLSYIRLFALGLCSGLLGSTFNGMALGLITQDNAVEFASPWIICTVLLLVGGHALNFALSIVGAFVHPVRLTFVEFFKNLGFEWGGKQFLPFCRASIRAK